MSTIKKEFKYLISLFLLFTIISCTHKVKDFAEIQKMLDTVSIKMKEGNSDTLYLNKTIIEIKQYAAKHQSDTLAAKLLFEAAQQLEAHHLSEKAVVLLDEIQTKFSNTLYAAKALVTEGFIYNNILHNYDLAKVKYEEYLTKYRNLDSNLSRDVELELHNMGKSAEDLIKEFETKLKEKEKQEKN